MTDTDTAATTAGGATPKPQGESLIDRIRRQRDAAATETTYDVPISGWGGMIVARYRLLDPVTEIEPIMDKIRRQYPDNEAAQNFYGGIDTMIAACEGLYAYDDDDEQQLKPLSLNGGTPAKYTDELAVALGTPNGTAREIVIGLFKGNKMAVGAHAATLMRKMMDPEGVLRLGES